MPHLANRGLNMITGLSSAAASSRNTSDSPARPPTARRFGPPAVAELSGNRRQAHPQNSFDNESQLTITNMVDYGGSFMC